MIEVVNLETVTDILKHYLRVVELSF